MRKLKSIICITIIFTILLTCFTINTYAADNDKLTLEFKVDSSSAKTDGVQTKIEAPYKIKNSVMLPLSWFTSSIGAEVINKGSNKFQIIYCDWVIDFTVGSVDYICNKENKKMSTAPVVKNKTVMVPLDLVWGNFPIAVTTTRGTYKIVLQDDGALKDLSFLTGGITSPAIGNSYFGWSINVPSGSRIISNSFNSNYVSLSNEARKIYMEISISPKKDKTLEDLYNDILYSSSKRESKIDKTAVYPFFQYTSLDEVQDAVLTRVYQKGSSFYMVSLYSYDPSVTPEKLLSDKNYYNLINSFSLNYKGDTRGISDVSKVKQGKANYYNYIQLYEIKYMPWSVEIPASWNKLYLGSDPFTTVLGSDTGHFMQITMSKADENKGFDSYVDGIKEKYDKTFNPSVYTFIKDDTASLGSIEARNLKFSILQNGKKYIMDEYYYPKDDFIYEISIKLPEKEYEKEIKNYTNAVSNIKYSDFDHNKYLRDLDNYNSKNARIRLAQQDDLTDYICKTYKWSIKIPGYWTKDSTDYEGSQTFENPENNVFVNISVLENSSLSKNLTDEERFGMIHQLTEKYGMKLVNSSNQSVNGFNVRAYNYSIQNDDYNMYSNVTIYCFENDKFTYSFMSIIPELTATDKTLREVDDIWKSMKIN